MSLHNGFLFQRNREQDSSTPYAAYPFYSSLPGNKTIPLQLTPQACQILPGQKLTLGNYLQCNRRTKPDQKPRPIPAQGNYPQGYLGQKASVTATIVSSALWARLYYCFQFKVLSCRSFKNSTLPLFILLTFRPSNSSYALREILRDCLSKLGYNPNDYGLHRSGGITSVVRNCSNSIPERLPKIHDR